MGNTETHSLTLGHTDYGGPFLHNFDLLQGQAVVQAVDIAVGDLAVDGATYTIGSETYTYCNGRPLPLLSYYERQHHLASRSSADASQPSRTQTLNPRP